MTLAQMMVATSAFISAREWSDPIIAMGTLVLAAVTALLAVFTKRLADVTLRPSVVAVLELHPQVMTYFNLEVVNEGAASAFDVTTKFDPPIPPIEAGIKSPQPLASLSILRAGQRVSSFATSYAALKDIVFTVTVSWARKPGSKKRETIVYKIAPPPEMSRLGDEPIFEIVKELKKAASAIAKIAGTSRLEVDVFTQDDRERERAEHAAWRQAAMARQDQPQPTTPLPAGTTPELGSVIAKPARKRSTAQKPTK